MYCQIFVIMSGISVETLIGSELKALLAGHRTWVVNQANRNEIAKIFWVDKES